MRWLVILRVLWVAEDQRSIGKELEGVVSVEVILITLIALFAHLHFCTLYPTSLFTFLCLIRRLARGIIIGSGYGNVLI